MSKFKKYLEGWPKGVYEFEGVETLHTLSDIEKALDQGHILARYHKLSPDSMRSGWIRLCAYSLDQLSTENGELSTKENIKIIYSEDELTDRNILDILRNIKTFHKYWNSQQCNRYMCNAAIAANIASVITLNEYITAKDYIDKIIAYNLRNIKGYTEQDIEQLKKSNKFDVITLGESLGLCKAICGEDMFHEEVKKWWDNHFRELEDIFEWGRFYFE